MHVIKYPHPTLRHPSKPLKRVDAELRKIVAEMIELMYEEDGVGLAANQVDIPYRLCIVNPTGDPDCKEQEYVFINPVIARRQGNAEAEEGCLSLPGIHAYVRRPQKVVVSAYNLQGEEMRLELDGLFARAIQHECDHLEGVLFVDRLSDPAKLAVRSELEELERLFADQRHRGEIPDDEQIARRLAELESLRT
ncbi:MAG: peptide deformylase [Patescibacteria group bacterium]|nr:peptide deformylase [Patescibacteria group bacterium]